METPKNRRRLYRRTNDAVGPQPGTGRVGPPPSGPSGGSISAEVRDSTEETMTLEKFFRLLASAPIEAQSVQIYNMAAIAGVDMEKMIQNWIDNDAIEIDREFILGKEEAALTEKAMKISMSANLGAALGGAFKELIAAGMPEHEAAMCVVVLAQRVT